MFYFSHYFKRKNTNYWLDETSDLAKKVFWTEQDTMCSICLQWRRLLGTAQQKMYDKLGSLKRRNYCLRMYLCELVSHLQPHPSKKPLCLHLTDSEKHNYNLRFHWNSRLVCSLNCLLFYERSYCDWNHSSFPQFQLMLSAAFHHY